MLIFPEGTDYDKNTVERSNNFATEHNLPKYTQVLHPRTTGFVYIFNLLNAQRMINHIDDVTVAYDGGAIPRKEVDFVLGNLPKNIHFYMDTYECEKLLCDGNDNNNNQSDELESRNKRLEVWLKERWQVKENFLVSFYAHKDTASLNSNEPLTGKPDAEQNPFDRDFQSLYETEQVSQFHSNLIFVYPVYWLVSMTLVCYLVYTYLLFKLYIMAAFLFFFVYCQLMGKQLDNYVVDTGRPHVSDVDASNKTE
jgi:hypothetical protein